MSRGRRSVASRSHRSRRRRDRHVHRIHPEQRHATQDEREDGRVELGATGVARGRHGATDPQRPQHVRQRRPADRVDRAGPAFRFERPALAGHLVPRPGSRPRPASAAGPPRRACRSRPRPRSRGRPGSRAPSRRHRPIAPVTRTGPSDGVEPALLEGDDGHRRGEAGRPDRHRVARREARRERHDPAGRDPLVFGVPAVARDAELVAVGQHGRAHRERRVVAARRPRRPGRCPGSAG